VVPDEFERCYDMAKFPSRGSPSLPNRAVTLRSTYCLSPLCTIPTVCLQNSILLNMDKHLQVVQLCMPWLSPQSVSYILNEQGGVLFLGKLKSVSQRAGICSPWLQCTNLGASFIQGPAPGWWTLPGEKAAGHPSNSCFSQTAELHP
jgi:hypothetical protein